MQVKDEKFPFLGNKHKTMFTEQIEIVCNIPLLVSPCQFSVYKPIGNCSWTRTQNYLVRK